MQGASDLEFWLMTFYNFCEGGLLVLLSEFGNCIAHRRMGKPMRDRDQGGGRVGGGVAQSCCFLCCVGDCF